MKTTKHLPILGGALACWLLAGVQASHAGSTMKEQVKAELEKETSKPKASETMKKPAWLTEASLTVSESYDSNVYQTSRGALANNDSAFTTVTPAVGMEFAKLLPSGSESPIGLKSLSLNYAPDIQHWHQTPGQNNTTHKIANTVAGGDGPWSYELKNQLAVVDGRDVAAIYEGGGLNAYSVAARDRQEGWRDLATLWFRYNFDENWFIRPTAYWNMNSWDVVHRSTAGYANWTSRWDANGGVDFGRKVMDKTFVTLGYRYGNQWQGIRPGGDINYSNEYHRILVGLEGKPFSWLTVDLKAGPDIRNFAGRAVLPRNFDEQDMVRTYMDGSASIALTSKDNIKLFTKQYQQVSSLGQNTYLECLYGIAWKHQWIKQFSTDLGFKAFRGDYEVGTGGVFRDDWWLQTSFGAAYALDEHWSLTAGYSIENAFPDHSRYVEREFTRHLGTFGVKWAW